MHSCKNLNNLIWSNVRPEKTKGTPFPLSTSKQQVQETTREKNPTQMLLIRPVPMYCNYSLLNRFDAFSNGVVNARALFHVGKFLGKL